MPDRLPRRRDATERGVTDVCGRQNCPVAWNCAAGRGYGSDRLMASDVTGTWLDGFDGRQTSPIGREAGRFGHRPGSAASVLSRLMNCCLTSPTGDDKMPRRDITGGLRARSLTYEPAPTRIHYC